MDQGLGGRPDGFAGAGEYENGVRGSPQIPLDIVARQAHDFNCPIEIRFIEKRPDRAAHLKQLIKEKKAKLVEASSTLQIIDPVEGDCEEVILDLIRKSVSNGHALGPAFFFLDQFGYSSFSMGLIRAILRHEVCETFSYLNWNLLHPFMTDDTKHAGITKAFGGDEWRSVLGLAGHEKENRFRQVYLDALRTRGGAKYAYPFVMRDSNDRVIYWLFFCTNNIRGLEEMKKAMWSVDGSGGFEFSDKFVSDRSSMFEYGDSHLAKDLVSELAGLTLSVKDIGEYALINTPAHKYLDALGIMERERQIRPIAPPAGRRAGAFKGYPDMLVEVRQVDKETQGELFR